MRYTTDDLRIKEIRELTPPAHLIREFPCEEPFARTVHGARMAAHEILHGHDDRLLVIVGPCSIHDPKAAMEYAQKLNEERRRLAGDLEIIMRVYFEKPRTTVGWKGLMNDPDMDGSCRINHGLRIARELLCDIVALGLPTGVEYLDMITPQYIADLVSWGAIGARTTESQSHRQLASGLSCPVGFKNGTDGNIKVAVDAIGAAEHSHSFLSVTKGGISAIVTTTGNEDCHIILRGGKEPNYDAQSVAKACEMLKANGKSFEGQTVVISGSGNVAIYANQKATQLGGKVVAMCDSNGYVYDPNGINLAKIIDIKQKRRARIKVYADEVPGSEYHEGCHGIWTVKCDIALPCATQNELNGADADLLLANKPICIAEVSNMGCTAEAAEKFVAAKQLFAPGKAVNAGGVATSGLEMTQNAMRLNWSEAEVDDKLHYIMHNIHDQCVKYGREADGYVDYVKGANIAGFMKVANAMMAQGIV